MDVLFGFAQYVVIFICKNFDLEEKRMLTDNVALVVMRNGDYLLNTRLNKDALRKLINYLEKVEINIISHLIEDVTEWEKR